MHQADEAAFFSDVSFTYTLISFLSSNEVSPHTATVLTGLSSQQMNAHSIINTSVLTHTVSSIAVVPL